MALITKEGKTIKDPYNGEIETAYTNIKHINIDLINQLVNLNCQTFNKKESKDNGSMPITDTPFLLDGIHFTEAMREKLREFISLLYQELPSLTEEKYDRSTNQDITIPKTLAGVPITDWQSDEI